MIQFFFVSFVITSIYKTGKAAYSYSPLEFFLLVFFFNDFVRLNLNYCLVFVILPRATGDDKFALSYWNITSTT